MLLLSDTKQMDFIVLKLTGGSLIMSADLGKGPASIISPVTFSDGDWHTVSRYTNITQLNCDMLAGVMQRTTLISDLLF